MTRLPEEELVETFDRLLFGHELETPEEVDTFLRWEGLDPEAIAAKGVEFAEVVRRALAEAKEG